MSPHPANFVFLLETWFLHAGQASLELPTSGDLPTLASQSAGIIGVSHGARPIFIFFKIKKYFIVLFIIYFIFEMESRSVTQA